MRAQNIQSRCAAYWLGLWESMGRYREGKVRAAVVRALGAACLCVGLLPACGKAKAIVHYSPGRDGRDIPPVAYREEWDLEPGAYRLRVDLRTQARHWEREQGVDAGRILVVDPRRETPLATMPIRFVPGNGIRSQTLLLILQDPCSVEVRVLGGEIPFHLHALGLRPVDAAD
jgi:hypothetical protein